MFQVIWGFSHQRSGARLQTCLRPTGTQRSGLTRLPDTPPHPGERERDTRFQIMAGFRLSSLPWGGVLTQQCSCWCSTPPRPLCPLIIPLKKHRGALQISAFLL